MVSLAGHGRRVVRAALVEEGAEITFLNYNLILFVFVICADDFMYRRICDCMYYVCIVLTIKSVEMKRMNTLDKTERIRL